jgi:hypothetical protein
MTEGVERSAGPVNGAVGEGFFLLFFINARSSMECQREAHLDVRLEPRPVRLAHASAVGRVGHVSPCVRSPSRNIMDSAAGIRNERTMKR